MKNFTCMALVAALAAVVSTDVVRADATNIRQVPVTGTSLQDALNAVTVGGSFSDVTTSQDPFALFSSTASGGSVATFVIEVAALSADNEFGIYDATTGTKAKVFNSSDTAGDQVLIKFLANGDVRVLSIAGDFLVATGFASPSNFGFYVDVKGASTLDGGDGVAGTLDYTVYTEDSKNVGGAAQALVFQGDGSIDMAISPFGPGPFTAGEFVLAFDDSLGGSDFSDLVVLVESITPVPAPGAVLLGMMGMGMVGWVRRRVG